MKPIIWVSWVAVTVVVYCSFASLASAWVGCEFSADGKTLKMSATEGRCGLLTVRSTGKSQIALRSSLASGKSLGMEFIGAGEIRSYNYAPAGDTPFVIECWEKNEKQVPCSSVIALDGCPTAFDCPKNVGWGALEMKASGTKAGVPR